MHVHNYKQHVLHGQVRHYLFDFQVKSLVLFLTHYPLLAELEQKYPQTVANFHMAYVEVEDSSESADSVMQLEC